MLGYTFVTRVYRCIGHGNTLGASQFWILSLDRELMQGDWMGPVVSEPLSHPYKDFIRSVCPDEDRVDTNLDTILVAAIKFCNFEIFRSAASMRKKVIWILLFLTFIFVVQLNLWNES